MALLVLFAFSGISIAVAYDYPEGPGGDSKDIPRYPDSIRTSYETSPQSTAALYLAKAEASQIADFYARELSPNGWSVEGVSYDESTQTTTIFAVKPDTGFVEIIISKSKEFLDYSEVETALNRR